MILEPSKYSRRTRPSTRESSSSYESHEAETTDTVKYARSKLPADRWNSKLYVQNKLTLTKALIVLIIILRDKDPDPESMIDIGSTVLSNLEQIADTKKVRDKMEKLSELLEIIQTLGSRN